MERLKEMIYYQLTANDRGVSLLKKISWGGEEKEQKEEVGKGEEWLKENFIENGIFKNEVAGSQVEWMSCETREN